jgi:hypothetical protein
MPEPLWIYLMALLYFTKVSTCSSMAEVFAEASHDCLTRTQAGDVLVFVGKLLSKSAQAQLTAHSQERGCNNPPQDQSDRELAPARDPNADVTRVLQQFQSEHGWDALGEEGRRIAQVLAGIASDNEWAQFKAWKVHLHKVLQFPFEAKIAESQERGPLRAGDQVTVQRITDVDDFYGILVRIKHKRGTSDFPLCDLAASDKASSNGVHVQDHAVWFTNR